MACVTIVLVRTSICMWSGHVCVVLGRGPARQWSRSWHWRAQREPAARRHWRWRRWCGAEGKAQATCTSSWCTRSSCAMAPPARDSTSRLTDGDDVLARVVRARLRSAWSWTCAISSVVRARLLSAWSWTFKYIGCDNCQAQSRHHLSHNSAHLLRTRIFHGVGNCRSGAKIHRCQDSIGRFVSHKLWHSEDN